jgi:hypothetical protein
MAGYIAITGERIGGQWAAYVYSGDSVISSEVSNDAPLLGSIETDIAGMRDECNAPRGYRLTRDGALSVVESWFADRGLQVVTANATQLITGAGGIYESNSCMGIFVRVDSIE